MRSILYYFVDYDMEFRDGISYYSMDNSKTDYLIFSLQDIVYITDTGKLAIL